MTSTEAGTAFSVSQAIVLVVDGDPGIRREIRTSLEDTVSTILEADSGGEALDRVINHSVDLVTTSINLNDMSGLNLLEEIKRRSSDTEVLVITGDKTVEKAVEAMQKGAFGYLTKPIRPEEIRVHVAKTLESTLLRQENRELRRWIRERKPRFIGNSPSIRSLLATVHNVAPTTSTVLLVGETGTGKELLAEEIHAHSRRAAGPLVRVNCAALPEELIDSELFGHVRGAFTGAIADRPGRFELAHGGTLFLDEVGDMSLATQRRLLRVLQSGELERVGSSKTIQVDVRLIAATNRDLRKAVAERRFREDLFYRLCVIELTIPPLRDRREDIPFLAYHFLRKFSTQAGKEVNTISPVTLEILMNYNWPGNVRELEHAIESAVILCTGQTLLPEMLPKDLLEACGVGRVTVRCQEEIRVPVGLTLKEAEREVVRQTLAAVGGDKQRARQVLGLSRSSFYRKLQPSRPNETRSG